jgi:hypothetical protein
MNITFDIIKSISINPDGYDLSTFTSIDDNAASELGNMKGYSLDLSGLENISNIAAEYISKFVGSLNLSGISGLSDSAANSLSAHKGTLELNMLKDISIHALENLIRHHQGSLSLNSLNDLPDSVAVIVSNQTNSISLMGIEEISELASEHLSKLVRTDEEQFMLENIYVQPIVEYAIFKNKLEDKSKIIGKPFLVNVEKTEWGELYAWEIEVAEFDFPFVMDLRAAEQATQDLGNNWEIPEIFELRTIYDKLYCNKLSRFREFDYWSSTPYPEDYKFTYVIDFNDGIGRDAHKSDLCFLRLIRKKRSEK